jgi:nicotinamide-nucleotide amidase
MRAEILTIGDELCRGEIVDTNSSWLAGQLWDLGITVTWMTSCRDDADDMRRAFREAAARADVVLVSGGLGPTEDDLTVDVAAEVAGVGIETHEPSLERMKIRFEKARFALTPNNLRQVRVPAGAKVHENPAGIAPGFEMRLGSSTLFVFPGVPREMQAIFQASVCARLGELVTGGEAIAKRTYRVFGKGESHIDHALAGIAQGTPGVTVHYQVAMPETLVKLVVKHADRALAEATLAALDEELRRRLGDLVYGDGSDSLAAAMGRALREAGATLAVAESCTGGMIGSLVTDVAGSSDYFKGGWIAYSNEVKTRDLGVSDEILRVHGAVSEECVTAMARGARERSGATFALAVSGVAGPGGGTPDKPVGTVHVALATRDGVRHRVINYPGARDQIRRLASFWAMSMVLREARSMLATR